MSTYIWFCKKINSVKTHDAILAIRFKILDNSNLDGTERALLLTKINFKIQQHKIAECVV